MRASNQKWWKRNFLFYFIILMSKKNIYWKILFENCSNQLKQRENWNHGVDIMSLCCWMQWSIQFQWFCCVLLLLLLLHCNRQIVHWLKSNSRDSMWKVNNQFCMDIYSIYSQLHTSSIPSHFSVFSLFILHSTSHSSSDHFFWRNLYASMDFTFT